MKNKTKASILAPIIIIGGLASFFGFVGFCSYIDTKYPEFWGYFGVGVVTFIAFLIVMWAILGLRKLIIEQYKEKEYNNSLN